jgi:hypothetical protein
MNKRSKPWGCTHTHTHTHTHVLLQERRLLFNQFSSLLERREGVVLSTLRDGA